MKYVQWGMVHSHVSYIYNECYIIIYNLRIYACRCVYVPLTVYFWDTHEDILVAVFFARDFFFFFPDRYLPRPSIRISTDVPGSIQRTRICFQKHSADRNGLPVISFSYEDQSNKQFVMRRLSSHRSCQETRGKVHIRWVESSIRRKLMSEG